MIILDFSQRLPGPFATNLLAQEGIRVIKMEQQSYPDPFCNKEQGLFYGWYQSFQRDKELFSFNLKEDHEELSRLIHQSQVILWGQKEGTKLYQFVYQEFLKTKETHFIHLRASLHGKSFYHDLNIMAETGLLSLYIDQKKEAILFPPFLPFGAMTFSQALALKILTLKMSNKKEHTIGLLEEVKRIWEMFWPIDFQKQKRFLHNGLYPCYCLYLTKDQNYLAVACVEERFWDKFTEIFALNLNNESRFLTEPHIFEEIALSISSKTSQEIEHIINHHDICLSLIRR